MAQFYTLEEAARVLGMSPDELKTQAQQRKVRAFMDGGSWRFRVADVDEMARRRGMGSDPDLSLSDLDLVAQSDSGSDEELNLAEFQLGVASPSGEHRERDSDQDILLDDLSLPQEQMTGSSSTILGMQSKGKTPSDSDVKLVPDNTKGASDSDVRIMPKGGAAPGGSDVRLAPRTGSRSDVTLAPMTPSGSDVRPSPEGKSDSDVKLGKGHKGLAPSDSDVTMVSDEMGSGSSDTFPASDPGETSLRPSPFAAGSSGDVAAIGGDTDDSDFELTPSSVIDALEPESGSDFELTALDTSDEFETTPRGPADSDVTAAEPASSGINLARPSDSGINLQSMGNLNVESADSIELAPLDEDAVLPKSGGKKKADLSATALPGKKADLSATALPGKKADLSATALPTKKADLSATSLPTKKGDPSATALPTRKGDPSATALPTRKGDPSATALPLKADKDLFDDTDFEVDALDTSGSDDQTVQLEAASDFDLEDSDSASEVFAIDEDDVDEKAATAMAPSVMDDEEEESFGEEEGVSGEAVASAWDVEAEATPSQVAARPVAAPVLAAAGAGPEWGGLWVGFLSVASVFMLVLTFVAMDLVRNLYDFQGDGPASGLIRSLAGMIGG
jgi:excisionase family DNA binding protein